MEIKTITDKAFQKYGFILNGYDFTQLLETLNANTEKPADHVIYQPGDQTLESLGVAAQLRDNLYGGMPIQVGYCNGYNHMLNCLEYHRGAEVNIAADNVILLLASVQQMEDGNLNTREIEAFALPAGTAVVLYETTLHYAPCCRQNDNGFRVVIILPKDTNTEKPKIEIKNSEDRLLWARNKWLIAHPESAEAASGAHVGLIGENISV